MSITKKINDPSGKVYDEISVGAITLDTEPIEGSFNTVTSDAVAKIAGGVADLDAIVPEDASEENKLATASDVAGVQEDLDGIEGKIPSDTSTTNKLVNESGLQDAIDAASESWSTGFTPKGESSVSDLNDLATQSNGDSYIVTDSGTLTDGTLAVVAGDQVAWESTNSVWYKLPQYALKSAVDNISDSIATEKNNGSTVFEFLYSESVNIFVKSNPVHGYFDQHGTFTQNASYRVTEPILLRPNKTYKLPFSSSLGGNEYVFVLNADGSFNRTIRGSVSDGFLTFMSPLNEWVMASFNMGTNYDESNFMVCEASQYPGSFVKGGGYQLHFENAPEELKTIAAVSPNLFDDSANGYLANTTIDGGVYGTTPNYYVSQPILVKGGVKYKATHKASVGSNFRYAVLDDEYNLVSTPSGSNDGGDTNYIVFTPSSDCYIRLSVGFGTSWAVANAGFILSEYDKFPEEYISYGRKIADDIGLGKKQEQEVVDIADKRPFKGKVLAVNGDSICKGEDAGGGYGQIIAEMFGMALQNRGTNGATITAGTTDGSGNNRRWICRDIQYMADNADYVLIEGGVNDSSLGVTMGDISEGYAATLDDETFAGAFESVVRDLLTKYPGKKVGYIAVHKMSNGYRSDGPETNYYWTAKKICEKWGMPFLDLNVSVPAFGFFSTDTPIGALRTNYTKSGDGWHPTEEGYKKYYVDKIIEFMRSL